MKKILPTFITAIIIALSALFGLVLGVPYWKSLIISFVSITLLTAINFAVIWANNKLQEYGKRNG